MVDVEVPYISNCPSDLTATTELGTSETVVDWTVPTAVDESPIVEIIQSHYPPARFTVGLTNVVYIFRDVVGNTATCTFTVNVIIGMKLLMFFLNPRS